jgi:hypothetical protein
MVLEAQESVMNRRIALTVGVTAGGLLATALLTASVAAADDEYTLYSQAPEVITQTMGLAPFIQETVGTDVFGAGNSPLTTIYGTFNADVTTLTTSWGFENQEIVVTGGQLGGLSVPTGSLFDYANFGGGWGNEYSDINGWVPPFEDPNTITDTLITPFGDFNIPTTFDAIALLEMPGAIIP